MTVEQSLIGAAVLLALASLARDSRFLRCATIPLAAAGLAWAILRHRGLVAGAAFGALGTINLLRVAATLPLPRRGVIRFSAEEAAMAERFTGLPRAAFRALLDQGLWIHGRAGETLIVEGAPVAHLFYLSEGEVVIASGGRRIATSAAGHFFGELDVLAHTPAIATVALVGEARFWCVTVDALERFLAANPDCRIPLELALAGELRDKLRLRNRQLATHD